jgi:hypothetical protein
MNAECGKRLVWDLHPLQQGRASLCIFPESFDTSPIFIFGHTHQTFPPKPQSPAFSGLRIIHHNDRDASKKADQLTAAGTLADSRSLPHHAMRVGDGISPHYFMKQSLSRLNLHGLMSDTQHPHFVDGSQHIH